MFKDKFKKELDAINPSAELELAVINKIRQEKEKTLPAYKKSYKKRWISAIAAALALVIVSVTAFNLPIFNEGQYMDRVPLCLDENIDVALQMQGLSFTDRILQKLNG